MHSDIDRIRRESAPPPETPPRRVYPNPLLPPSHIYVNPPSPPLPSVESPSPSASSDIALTTNRLARSRAEDFLSPPRNTGKNPYPTPRSRPPLHPFFNRSPTLSSQTPPRPARSSQRSSTTLRNAPARLALPPVSKSVIERRENVLARGIASQAATVEDEEIEEEIEEVRDGMLYQGNRPPVPVAAVPIHHTSEILDKFLSLHYLPGLQAPLPTHLHAPYRDAARRCARAYLDKPSEATLLNILALPKVGLPPKSLGKRDNPVGRLNNYPMVPWPQSLTESLGGVAVEPAERAVKMVKKGKIGQAGKALAGTGALAQFSEGVGLALQNLHPSGELSPFSSNTGPKNSPPPPPTIVNSCLRSFNKETSPGISGWTVPLLQIAAKDPTFSLFLYTYTSTIVSGTAPGADMLCTSRITSLLKKEELGVEGGIRPIAVGELIYRLALKSIVRGLVKRDMLSRCQFGVGTKGGVEPVVRLMDRAVNRELEGDYQYITSLDLKNAFNLIPRRKIATSLTSFAPGLYRCAKWAYRQKTRLVVPNSDRGYILYSSEGVRQGDPIGPFLFSVAYRPILEALRSHLGTDFIVVAYLDDTYVLSKSIDPLPTIVEFFSRPESALQLNTSKSKSYKLDEIRENGMEILGTMIGPESARRAFLNKKVDKQIDKLTKLSLLPQSQHQLLIFSSCYQHDLRHLLRTLDTSDLGDIWDRLDQAYSDIITRLRGSGQVGEYDLDIITLPVKMGGLGILSHRECSVHARGAAMEAADRMLMPILDQVLEDGEDEEVKSQGDRCKEMLEIRRDDLMDRMEAKKDDLGRKGLVENASVLGRRWLTAIPYNSSGQLSNFEISCGLHYRTIHTSILPCSHCASSSCPGHDEACRSPTRPQWQITRHNGIVHAIADTLSTVNLTRVEVEPATTDHSSRRRNDLRVIGSRDLGNVTTEHDVKVYTIYGDHVHKSYGVMRDGITKAPEAGAGPWKKTSVQLSRYLDEVKRETVRNQPGCVGEFTALVFSSGGLVEKETAERLEQWKQAVSGVAWSAMLRRMSLSLLRSRARTWEVRVG